MRSKTIRKTIRIMVCVLMVFALLALSEQVTARQQENNPELSTNELLLVLDTSLPSFVGKKFNVIFTAVTKAPTVTVTMYFDGLITEPVWQETNDFFINQKASIDCVAAEILVGIAHEFHILAEDSEGASKSISKTMNVDVDDPIFTFLSLEHLDANNHATKVDEIESIAMKEGESLRLNWTVQDENFLWVRYYVDDKTNEQSYGASSTLIIDWENFEIDIEGVTEQTYTLRIKALDKAKNTAEHSWQIKYSQPVDPTIPQETYDADIAEKEQQKEDAKNGVIWGSTIFGLFGAIGAVFAAKFSRDNLKGYAGIRDQSGLVKIEDKNKYYHYEKPRHRFFRSRFGLVVLISSLVMGALSVIAFSLGKWLQPSAETYFATYFFKYSLGSLLLFFILVFVISFQFIIKGDFNDIFSNETDEPKNQAAGWLISFFTEGDKKYLITSSFIDSCNGDYFDITFTDRDRMNYDLNMGGDTTRTMYIPAKDINITKNGIEIEQFEMEGQKHVQEVLDGVDQEERSEAQTLSEINEDIAVELTESKSKVRFLENNTEVIASRKTAKELAIIATQEAAVSGYIKLEKIKTAEEIEEEAKKKLAEEEGNVSQ